LTRVGFDDAFADTEGEDRTQTCQGSVGGERRFDFGDDGLDVRPRDCLGRVVPERLGEPFDQPAGLAPAPVATFGMLLQVTVGKLPEGVSAALRLPFRQRVLAFDDS